jgi:hypothetical protein
LALLEWRGRPSALVFGALGLAVLVYPFDRQFSKKPRWPKPSGVLLYLNTGR